MSERAVSIPPEAAVFHPAILRVIQPPEFGSVTVRYENSRPTLVEVLQKVRLTGTPHSS